MDQKRTDREGYGPPTVPQVLWWTMVIIIVLSIFVFVSPYYSDTLRSWLDIVVLPAAVVFLAFVLNEAVKAKDNAEKKRERDRDRRNAENENRKDFLMHMMRAYNGAKKVRRVLKAHRSNGTIPCTVYEAQLETLIAAQLELELYKPEEARSDKAERLNALLPTFENKSDISCRLNKLQEYLKGIIDEYDEGRYAEEKKKLEINGASCRIPLQNLPELEKFIDTRSFNLYFSGPVRTLAEKVKNEIERAHNNGMK
jgi:hypothetical protein